MQEQKIYLSLKLGAFSLKMPKAWYFTHRKKYNVHTPCGLTVKKAYVKCSLLVLEFCNQPKHHGLKFNVSTKNMDNVKVKSKI